MLKIISIELLSGNPIFVGKSNIVDEVSGDNEIGQTKSKNVVMPNSLAKSKSLVELSSEASFLTFRARLVFIKLRQTFIKTLIFHPFYSKCYIWIKTDMLGYAIGEIPNQLTLDNLGWWHLVVFSFRKMILEENWYKTYNGELFPIIEAFKS